MQVTLFMAMSVNGMAARPDGGEDFLSDENWATFSQLVANTKNFIIGQRTYEAVKAWNENYNFDDFTDALKIVMSDDPTFEPDPGYQTATSPQAALNHIAAAGYDHALLTGGPTTNTAFAKNRLITDSILNIEPVIIGQGLNVFKPAEIDLPLKLISTERIGENIVQLRYRVRGQ